MSQPCGRQGELGAAPTFKPGDVVEYDSVTCGRWRTAIVQQLYSDGTCDLDIKKGADLAKIRHKPARGVTSAGVGCGQGVVVRNPECEALAVRYLPICDNHGQPLFVKESSWPARNHGEVYCALQPPLNRRGVRAVEFRRTPSWQDIEHTFAGVRHDQSVLAFQRDGWLEVQFVLAEHPSGPRYQFLNSARISGCAHYSAESEAVKLLLGTWRYTESQIVGTDWWDWTGLKFQAIGRHRFNISYVAGKLTFTQRRRDGHTQSLGN